MSQRRILVTGASGFVGTALVHRLGQEARFLIRAASRRPNPESVNGVEFVRVGDLASGSDWSAAVDGVDTVVHLAARVHVMRDTAVGSLTMFRKTNTAGTKNLAMQAARAGVRRFVYLSSIKVNGEQTLPGQPFTERDLPRPLDPYSVSKHEAELGLRGIGQETGMEVVTIRPPLVYGPRVQANFRTMMRWLCRGVPLPLGAIDNRRSMVAVDNLVDLIVTSVQHPSAANQTFLVSDGEDLSTTHLLKRLGQALGHPPRLIPVPATVLRASLIVLGRREMVQRLCGSLQVDISQSRQLLGWKPLVSVDEGLHRVARDFLGEREG